jgi:hypothetical protein
MSVRLLPVGLLTSMPVIDLTGIDTQLAPMVGIAEVLNDYRGGFASGVETLSIIEAIVTEWRQ